VRRLLLRAPLLLLLAGCAGAAGNAPATAEPMKERLTNQARAVALLEAENQKLREELREVKKENGRLRERLAGEAGEAGKQ